MGFRFDGYCRLTFQFNDGWKGEDEYQYFGEFMILKSRLRHSNHQDSSNGEAGERIYTVRVPRGISRGDIINALRDAFTNGCRCEHDCCGHVQWSGRVVRRNKRREWLVELRASRNV